jgi:hypothetical protein
MYLPFLINVKNSKEHTEHQHQTQLFGGEKKKLQMRKYEKQTKRDSSFVNLFLIF